jgi:hypothetical protein
MTREELEGLVRKISDGLRNLQIVEADGHAVIRVAQDRRYSVRLFRKDIDRHWSTEFDVPEPGPGFNCHMLERMLVSALFWGVDRKEDE